MTLLSTAVVTGVLMHPKLVDSDARAAKRSHVARRAQFAARERTIIAVSQNSFSPK